MTSIKPSISHLGSPVSGKEFTEKWLQALTLAASQPAARRVRPLLADIDGLCLPNDQQAHIEIATRVWEFAEGNGLRPLLFAIPFRHGPWRFEGDEAFVFEHADHRPDGATKFDDWTEGLGFANCRQPLIAIVNHDDWSEILRAEAIRLRKPLKVDDQSMSRESLLWLKCDADWDRSRWRIQFLTPDWMTRDYDSVFEVVRPALNHIEKLIETAIDAVSRQLLKGVATAPGMNQSSAEWMHSIPVLLPLHQKLLADDRFQPPSWLFRTWSCVWPVIYREQNRLRGPCDIDILRRELDVCFRSVPQLTLWMFAFAKLICHHQLGAGLGICGDFIDA